MQIREPETVSFLEVHREFSGVAVPIVELTQVLGPDRVESRGIDLRDAGEGQIAADEQFPATKREEHRVVARTFGMLVVRNESVGRFR